MCGRTTHLYTWREIYELYRLTARPGLNIRASTNVAPTEDVCAVLPGEEHNRLVSARWGLVPAWWKKPLRDLPSTFNARAETVAEKPMFRAAFKSRRCIVPVSGFFEWTGPKGERLPWYITRTDGAPLSLAGLWEAYRDPETGEDGLSATIIVTEANPFMAQLHHRMPVILRPDEIEAWLAEPRADLLRPMPGDDLQAWRVTPRVNSSRYKEPDAIEPIAA
jgi:putative SOS response-associated peptidase YedK